MTNTGVCLSASQEPAGMPWDWGADPDLWQYRERTQAILRRYARMSVETGRLPGRSPPIRLTPLPNTQSAAPASSVSLALGGDRR